LADHQTILNEVKRVHGRRHGRPLSPARQNAFDKIYPLISIDKDLLTEDSNRKPANFFSRSHDSAKVILEIGFGNGERLAEAIRRNPDTLFLGAEPFVNGMTAFLRDIEKEDFSNVRVLMDDALMIVHSLTDESVDEIYILNPDPWHKTRHHKRRIVRKDTLPAYHRILKPGGKLIMTTDVRDLAEWMQIETEQYGGFEWLAEKPADWKNPPQDWIRTRYETKGAKGSSQMIYLFYKKK
jgi:tRNA (guanine-N7-)-methyltransferase